MAISEANLAVCWDLRFATLSDPLPFRSDGQRVQYPALLAFIKEGSENATGADNQQGSLTMTPQRLNAGHPVLTG